MATDPYELAVRLCGAEHGTFRLGCWRRHLAEARRIIRARRR